MPLRACCRGQTANELTCIAFMSSWRGQGGGLQSLEMDCSVSETATSRALAWCELNMSQHINQCVYRGALPTRPAVLCRALTASPVLLAVRNSTPPALPVAIR
ncbi:hypothetical protein MRB53_039681 [Persea americana]|nr:hypothetical protein MRB53_039681 [Persea americana]